MTEEVVSKKRGNPNWHKGMASANPKGRGKNSKNTMTKLQETLIEEFSGEMTKDFRKVIRRVIKSAQEGDMTAAKLLLDRAIPSRKAVEHYGAGEGMGGVTVIVTGIDGTEGRVIPKSVPLEGDFEEIEDGVDN